MEAGCKCNSERIDEGEFFLLGSFFNACGRPQSFLKARAATEGNERFAYCEPSNENVDDDNDRMLQKALIGSGAHYLRHGNVDLNHFTKIGHRLSEFMKGATNMSIEEASLYELGHPVEVLGHGHRFRKTGPGAVFHEENSALDGLPLMLKAAIRKGEGARYDQANRFWEGLTSGEQSYYPSVAGNTLHQRCQGGVCTVTTAQWNNTAFATAPFCPRNRTVDPVTHVAPAQFVKAVLPPAEFLKALTTGYTTDVANLSGGEALRRESLQGSGSAPGHSKAAHYDAAAARLVLGPRCKHAGNLTAVDSISEHFANCEGVDGKTAAAWARRFARELTAQRHDHTRETSAARAA